MLLENNISSHSFLISDSDILVYDIVKPISLSESDIQIMYEIRCNNLNIKDYDPNRDKEYFINDVKICDYIFIIRKKSQIVFMTCLYIKTYIHKNIKYNIFYLEYGHKKPDIPNISVSYFILLLLYKYPNIAYFNNIYLYVDCLPASFNLFKRYFPNVLTLFDNNISPLESELLFEITKFYRKNDFNTETKLVSTNVMLKKIRLSDGLKKSSNFAFYEKHNPNWSEGYVISIIIPITLWKLILTITNYIFDRMVNLINKIYKK